MKFLKYVEGKRYFLILFIIMMSFVTLMMMVSSNKEQLVGNIIYTNLGCIFLASIYIITGYFYHNSFYKQLNELINSDEKEILEAAPQPQNYEQELYMELLKKVHSSYMDDIEKLYNEKKEHQDFIMSWIHEVKLPITASFMLMRNSADKTVDYLVDKFEDELHKIENYVEQALYYSRIDSFSKDYFITEISLNKVIRESIKKHSKLFINKRITFTIWDEEQFVQSDSKWLSFIIDQIISNSLKYTNDGGSISFIFEEDSKEKLLRIKDTGIGIKPEDINRVFEKGFTGSTGRNYSKSTGMGLYLAKQMVLKLGHNISIQSEEGKYTMVNIHFPKSDNYYLL